MLLVDKGTPPSCIESLVYQKRFVMSKPMKPILLFDAKHTKGRRAPILNEPVFVNKDLYKFEMRPVQRTVYLDHRQHDLFIPCSPPGSGKSTIVKFCAAERLEQDKNLKVIIAVPDLDIGRTFRKVILDYSDGREIPWDIDPERDLCGSNGNGSKINKIVQFIKSPAGSILSRRILLCSHSSLVSACGQISNGELKNTWFIVDEAHHSQYDMTPDEEEISNKLGKLLHRIVSLYLKEKTKTMRLWLPTATFFRGDGLSILPKEYVDLFEKYYLPLDEHWEQNIKYIQSYSYYFVPYKGLVLPEIRQILSGSKIPTIIFCPMSSQHVSGGCKYEFTDDLKKEIHKVWPGARIMDLVDEGNREKNREILDKSPESIDVILSLRVFDEGSDWAHAAQVLDLVGSNSLRISHQRFGRLLRDIIGKDHISYYQFVPFVAESLDEDDYRKQLSCSWATLAASMVLEDYIRPVKIPKPKKKSEKKSKEKFNYVNYFRLVVPNEGDQRNIWNDVACELINLRGASNKIPGRDKIKKVIKEVLKNNGVTRFIDEISCQIVGQLRRRALGDYGVDVSKIVHLGFDKIWSDKIFNMLLAYGTGITGKKSFSELRQLFKKYSFLPLEDFRERARFMYGLIQKMDKFDLQKALAEYSKVYPVT